MANASGGLSSVVIQEMLTMVDMGALLADPIFYGIGVARGDHRPVVIIPGLFGSDFYLCPLHQWLCRVGYSPVGSRLDFNAGCIDRLRAEIYQEIIRRSENDPRPIALIGHSRGGIMAWALASQLQERVSHLVMLGSAVASMMVSVESGHSEMPLTGVTRMLMNASTFARRLLDPDCDFPSCDCKFMREIDRPLSPQTAVLAIYGNNDLIVPKRAHLSVGQILHVNASHVGLVYNPNVYRALGRFLASRPQDSAVRSEHKDRPVLRL
jgi:triacylglycerol lipase